MGSLEFIYTRRGGSPGITGGNAKITFLGSKTPEDRQICAIYPKTPNFISLRHTISSNTHHIGLYLYIFGNEKTSPTNQLVMMNPQKNHTDIKNVCFVVVISGQNDHLQSYFTQN